jgi:hypothetical protein
MQAPDATAEGEGGGTGGENAPRTPPAAGAPISGEAPRGAAGAADAGVLAVPGLETMASARFRGVSAYYSIHITSFREEERAARDALRLETATGYPTDFIDYTITSPGKNQGLWYRVIVGKFTRLDEAQDAARSIRETGISDYARVYRIAGR